MDTLLTKSAREIYFEMDKTFFNDAYALNEPLLLQWLIVDSLVKRNELFYKNPFETINNEVSNYTLKEKKINYLFTQKLHSANKLSELEENSKIKVNDPNPFTSRDFLSTFLLAILKDYKNGYYPKLSYYNRVVIELELECLNKIRAIGTIKNDKEFTEYYSKAANLAMHCMTVIFTNVFALVMEIEIENHCTKLLNELQGNTETPTDKKEPETNEDENKKEATRKQKFLLLQELGFFELEKFTNLPHDKNRIEILEFLFERTNRNIRSDWENRYDNNYFQTKGNLKVVNDLLKKVGLDEIKKKG
jgi:hypothetical protein